MDIKIKNEQVVVNGKPMPFSAEELTKILNIMKKAIAQSAEELSNKDKEKILDSLLNELNG